jgi:hypothetical protein
MSRKIKKSVCVAVVIEAIALATSFGLFALHHGREPLEPPFNLIGTLLQMPGLIIANTFYPITVWQNGILILPITFVVQSTIWFAIIFGILTWREKKRPNLGISV